MSERLLDVRGAKCPVPIVKAKQALDAMAPGETVRVLSTDPGSVADFQGWAMTSKLATLMEQTTETDDEGPVYVHVLARKA